MTKADVSLRGVFTPIVTPFDEHGQVDHRKLEFNLEKWNQTGLSGYIVLGSNGENVYLNEREKVNVLTTARRAIPSEKLMIAGTACESTINTIALTEDGKPLQSIEVDVVAVSEEIPPPPPGAYVIGYAYDLGLAGATFNPPITLTLHYDPELIPEGVVEADLFIAYYDVATGQWVSLPSTVDTENNTITAEVSHLTIFAILTPPVVVEVVPFNMWLVFGPILGVLAVAGLAFYFLIRRGLITRRRTTMARYNRRT